MFIFIMVEIMGMITVVIIISVIISSITIIIIIITISLEVLDPQASHRCGTGSVLGLGTGRMCEICVGPMCGSRNS